eukprot:1938831-Karenia_brevis.AAC.1
MSGCARQRFQEHFSAVSDQACADRRCLLAQTNKDIQNGREKAPFPSRPWISGSARAGGEPAAD